MTTICRGVKADGSACRIERMLGTSGYCLFHDPARRNEAQAVRDRGNMSRRRAKQARAGRDVSITVTADQLPIDHPPENMDEALALAAWAATAVLTGAIDPRTGMTAAKLVDSFRMAIKDRDILNEVQRLKQLVRDLKARRGEAPTV